jgi:hypothetical protein
MVPSLTFTDKQPPEASQMPTLHWLVTPSSQASLALVAATLH